MHTRIKAFIGTALFGIAGLITGCSSIDQVTTPPPVPAVHQPDDISPPVTARSAFSVTIDTGDSLPPDEIASLRFRIAEVWIKPVNEDWERRRVQTGSIRVTSEDPVNRTILTASIPSGTYERVALLIENVRAEYQGNAGGALASPEGVPVEIDMMFEAADNRSVLLQLLMDTGASIWQDADCRWHFMPVVIPDIVEATQPETS